MGAPHKYRVQISRGGSKSYRYFDTLEQALSYEHPREVDPFGFARKQPRITIQENFDGELNKYRKVEGLVSIKIERGKVTMKAL